MIKEKGGEETAKMFFRTIFHCCNLSFNSINVVWDMFSLVFCFATSNARKGTLNVCWTYLNSLFINQHRKSEGGLQDQQIYDGKALFWGGKVEILRLQIWLVSCYTEMETLWTLPPLEEFRNLKLILLKQT